MIHNSHNWGCLGAVQHWCHVKHRRCEQQECITDFHLTQKLSALFGPALIECALHAIEQLDDLLHRGIRGHLVPSNQHTLVYVHSCIA